MSDISKLDLYCREAQSIIAHSEEIVRCMRRAGACEGHLLMADQGLVALRHLGRIIERSRKRSVFEAPSVPIDASLPAKQGWWSVIWRRPGVDDRALETRT
jgi:hypothetical protein